MLVRLLAMLLGALRVRLGIFVFALLVVVCGLIMMVRGRLMGRRRILVVLLRRMFGRLGHERDPLESY
jgi:hypothetical protein